MVKHAGIKFNIGDKVYHTFYGWGTVTFCYTTDWDSVDENHLVYAIKTDTEEVHLTKKGARLLSSIEYKIDLTMEELLGVKVYFYIINQYGEIIIGSGELTSIDITKNLTDLRGVITKEICTIKVPGEQKKVSSDRVFPTFEELCKAIESKL